MKTREQVNAEARERHRKRMLRPEYKARRAAQLKAWNQRAYRNPEYTAMRRRQQIAWMAAHPDYAKNKMRELRKRPGSREKIRATQRASAARNKDKVKARSRAYYLKHKAEIKIKDRIYRIKNAAQKAATNRAWRLRNVEKCRIHSQANLSKRKALQLKTQVDTRGIKDFIRSVRSSPLVTCAYCGIQVPGTAVQIDHMIPLARGGPHALSNLCIACKPCNNSKCDKTAEEFKTYRAEILSIKE